MICTPYMYMPCMIYTPDMYAWYVCLVWYVCLSWYIRLICMPDMYAWYVSLVWYVCLICMPDMYALYVCLTRMRQWLPCTCLVCLSVSLPLCPCVCVCLCLSVSVPLCLCLSTIQRAPFHFRDVLPHPPGLNPQKSSYWRQNKPIISVKRAFISVTRRIAASIRLKFAKILFGASE